MAVVTIEEVKRHGNITADSADAELVAFVATAQAMVEHETGPAEAVAVTETHRAGQCTIWLRRPPVLTVTSITEYGLVLSPTFYTADLTSGRIARTGSTFGGTDVVVVYVAGRDPVPEGIRWAVMELTIHLWRSTQAQRGGRGRGEDPVAPAAFGLPHRVAHAIVPYRRAPAVA